MRANIKGIGLRSKFFKLISASLTGGVAGVLLLTLAFPRCDMGGGPTPIEYQEEEYIVDEQEWTGNWDEGGAGWQDGGEGTGGFSTDQSSTSTAPQMNWSVENELSAESGSGEVEQSDWKYQLNYSDIVLSPDGTSLLAMIPLPGPDKGFEEPGLALVAMTLPNGQPRLFPHVRNIIRINFSPDGSIAYVLNQGGQKVTSIAMDTFEVTGSHSLDGVYSVIDVAADGTFLFASNVPRTPAEMKSYLDLEGCEPPESYALPQGADLCRVGVVEFATGYSWSVEMPSAVRDVDYLVGEEDMIVTYGFRIDNFEGNRSTVQFYDLETREFERTLLFPNCADELVIAPGEAQALLSPTFCAFQGAEKPDGGWQVTDTWAEEVPGQTPPPAATVETGYPPPAPPDCGCACEPISIIDLKTRTFVRNLPGFGPVALSDDGKTAVGFTRKELMEEQWNYYGQNEPYGIVVIDLPTQSWSVVDFGPAKPAYFIAPDNKTAGLYSYQHSCKCVENLTNNWDECFGTNYGNCKDVCCNSCCQETKESRFYWLDLKTLGKKSVVTPTEPMRKYAWDAHGDAIFALWNQQLLRLSFDKELPEPLELSWWPRLIESRPQGDYLLLAPGDWPEYYLYDLQNQNEAVKLDLNILETGIESTKDVPPTPSGGSPFDIPGIAVRLRISDATFGPDNLQCTEAPGADIDAVALVREESLEVLWAWEVTEVSGQTECGDNMFNDAVETLGPFDASIDLTDPATPENAAGFFSLDGRSIELAFENYAPLEKGDTLVVYESDFNSGFDAGLDTYDVDLAIYDAATGQTSWIHLFVGAEGYRQILIDW